MKPRKIPSKEEKRHEIIKSRLITIEVSDADAKRLVNAFAEGKLKDLGVIDVILPSELETEMTPGRWTNKERHKKQKPKNNDLE